MRRELLFKNYHWVALFACGIAAILIFQFGKSNHVELAGGVFAAAIGFCYFVQQQKLAETELFYRLFMEFNRRYDEMNGRLSGIRNDSSQPTSEQRDLIVDYFNLCAEEYLFYKEGYIYSNVWQSWCRGMKWYLECSTFRDVWDEEMSTDSFYGLSIEVIERGMR